MRRSISFLLKTLVLYIYFCFKVRCLLKKLQFCHQGGNYDLSVCNEYLQKVSCRMLHNYALKGPNCTPSLLGKALIFVNIFCQSLVINNNSECTGLNMPKIAAITVFFY